jgi:MFS family permease
VGAKRMMVYGCTMYAVAMFLCSLITNFYLFFFVYCFICGFGLGLTYLVPLHIGWNYFPKRKGMISSLVLFSFSFGALIGNFFTTFLMNSGNEMPTEIVGDNYFYRQEIYQKVPKMFISLSILITGMSAIAYCLITEPKINTNEPQLSHSESFYNALSESNPRRSEIN